MRNTKERNVEKRRRSLTYIHTKKKRNAVLRAKYSQRKNSNRKKGRNRRNATLAKCLHQQRKIWQRYIRENEGRKSKRLKKVEK